jgi:hypothetical protein
MQKYRSLGSNVISWSHDHITIYLMCMRQDYNKTTWAILCMMSFCGPILHGKLVGVDQLN